MTAFTEQALHDEITNDPNGIGYKNESVWKSDTVIAGLLNTVIEGNTITRKNISPKEICYSIVRSEVAGISLNNRYLLDLYLSLNENIDATDVNVFIALNEIFDVNTMPNSRMLLLSRIKRDGSRAEKLWGESTVISASNVGQSANLGA